MTTQSIRTFFSHWRLPNAPEVDYHSRINVRAVAATAFFITLILLTAVTSHRYISTMVTHGMANVNIRVFVAIMAGAWVGTAVFAEMVNMLFISRAITVHDEKVLSNLMKRRIFAVWLKIDYIIPRTLWCTATSVMLVGVRDGGYGPFASMGLLWGPVTIMLGASMLFYGISILALIASCLDMGVRVDRHK